MRQEYCCQGCSNGEKHILFWRCFIRQVVISSGQKSFKHENLKNFGVYPHLNLQLSKKTDVKSGEKNYVQRNSLAE